MSASALVLLMVLLERLDNVIEKYGVACVVGDSLEVPALEPVLPAEDDANWNLRLHDLVRELPDAAEDRRVFDACRNELALLQLDWSGNACRRQ
jgi:hypothetical protein